MRWLQILQVGAECSAGMVGVLCVVSLWEAVARWRRRQQGLPMNVPPTIQTIRFWDGVDRRQRAP